MGLELDNCDIVKYSLDFKSQTLELLKHLWSQDVSLNAACLEWKYNHNPYLDAQLIYLAFYDGQIVGMLGTYGTKWQVGDPSHTFVGLCFSDLVIHPDYRNLGLFQKIMEFALDDLSNTDYMYVFDLSASPGVALAVLMRGWRSIGFLQTAHWQTNQKRSSGQLQKYIPRFSLVTSTYRRLRSYSQRLLSSHSQKQRLPFDVLDRNGIQHRHNTNPHISVERAPRPEAMAELVERVGNDGRIRHVRDRQYFAWRFNNPLSIFRFLFWEDARMEGYLVLQTSLIKGKVRIGIVDMEAANLRVLSDLLHATIRLGNFDNLNIWSATLSDEIKVLLQDIGFSFVNETGSIIREVNRPTVLIRPVRQEMLQTTDWIVANVRLLDLANWDLRMIYSDSV